MATYLNFRTAGPYTLNTADAVKSTGLSNADIDNNFYTLGQKKLENNGWTSGSLLYGNASGILTSRAIGTTGQVLTVSGGVPVWSTPLSYTTAGAQTAVNNVSIQFKDSLGNTITTTQFQGNNGTFVRWDSANSILKIESGFSQQDVQIFSAGASTNKSSFVDNGATGSITFFVTGSEYTAISQVAAGDKIRISGCTSTAAANNKSYEVIAVTLVSASEIRIDVDDPNVVTVNSGTTGNTPTLTHWKQHFSGNNWRGDLVVTGNLTVSGTTTTVNSETVNIADNILTLNSNYTGSSPTESAGIEVERGTLSNTALLWNEGTDRWSFTNDGSTYNNIPIPSEYDNYGSWTALDNDGISYTITSQDSLQFKEGQLIDVAFTNDDELTISHKDVARINTGSSTTLSPGNSFNVVSTVSTSSTGHVIEVNTVTYTLPADKFQEIISDSTNTEQYITFVSDATGLQTGKSNANIRVNPSTATISATNFNSTSDSRYKKDLEVITNGLDRVLQLTGYTFTMIESGERSTGIIAQDLEKVLPEAVSGTEDKKTVSYGNMMGMIVEAIKELNYKINDLQKQINDK